MRDEKNRRNNGRPVHQEAMAHPHRHQHRRFRERRLRLAAGAVLPSGGKARPGGAVRDSSTVNEKKLTFSAGQFYSISLYRFFSAASLSHLFARLTPLRRTLAITVG